MKVSQISCVVYKGLMDMLKFHKVVFLNRKQNRLSSVSLNSESLDT